MQTKKEQKTNSKFNTRYYETYVLVIETERLQLTQTNPEAKPTSEKEKKEKSEGRSIDTYRDLVKRDLRLEVDVISWRRKDAFHFQYQQFSPISQNHSRFDLSLGLLILIDLLVAVIFKPAICLQGVFEEKTGDHVDVVGQRDGQ